jgi:transposase-like protein
MVTAVRNGRSQQEVAREFCVSPSTVHHWVQQARGRRLDRVDWQDRSRAPGTTQRTDPAIEAQVLAVRRELERSSDLGFHGAEAIHQVLSARKVAGLPTVRTINRILRRSGVLDGQARVHRHPPPLGWYLPEVAQGRRELDCFDVVEGLVIKGGPHVEVLNGISLQGGLAGSWPTEASVTAKFVVECLIEHWKEVGLPGYAQFDNDMIFQGPHAHPDVVGRVTRLCLGLGVVPVFVPPREMGFQAMMEGYNGTWQAKVWSRFEHESLTALQGQSARFVAAHRRHRAARIESAPQRRAFPERWALNLQARPRGQIVYIRRTDAVGKAELLGHHFEVDGQWLNRLVRAEVDLDGGVVRFHRLRRREPSEQPLLKQVEHRLPRRAFHE